MAAGQLDPAEATMIADLIEKAPVPSFAGIVGEWKSTAPVAERGGVLARSALQRLQ